MQVYLHMRDDGLTPKVQGPRGSMIDYITFATNGIVKLWSKDLNSQKASGSDKMSACILKECANEVGDKLILLFSILLAQRSIHEEWKHATINPVYKGNNKNQSKAESSTPIGQSHENVTSAMKFKSLWNKTYLVPIES